MHKDTSAPAYVNITQAHGNNSCRLFSQGFCIRFCAGHFSRRFSTRRYPVALPTLTSWFAGVSAVNNVPASPSCGILSAAGHIMWGENLMARQGVASDENNGRALTGMAEWFHETSFYERISSKRNAKRYVQHFSKIFFRLSSNWKIDSPTGHSDMTGALLEVN